MLYANEELADELYVLVRNGLTQQLDRRLSHLSNAIECLTSLRWYDREQLSLLMVAAQYGYDEIVRILFTYCEPQYQVELQGTIVADDDTILDGITALYCACYRAHFTVARLLLDLGGANVNHSLSHELPYPLLIHATKIDRLDIVQFLLDNGYADVNETRSTSRTQSSALMWAIRQNHMSIVKYLLKQGADVNYACRPTSTSQCAVPLTLAVSRGHLELVRMLCDYGADTNVKNKVGDTLLDIAVKRGHRSIVHFLLKRSIITIDEVDRSVLSFVHRSSSRTHLRQIYQCLYFALQERLAMQIPKICRPPMAVYDYHQECQTIAELQSIKNDPNRIWIEVLLVLERILLPENDPRLATVMNGYKDYLLDNNELDKCLALLMHSYSLCKQMQRKMDLYPFVRLFCKMITDKKTISIDCFMEICYFSLDPSHISSLEKNVYNQLCFIIIAAKLLEHQKVTCEEQLAIGSWVSQVCRQRSMLSDGQTFVHLCITGYKHEYRHQSHQETAPYLKFPNESALRLVLACARRWLDLDAVETLMNNTALHLVCDKLANETLIKLLLDTGAHVDCVNHNGLIPEQYTNDQKIKTLLRSKSTPPRLKCLCARMVTNRRLNVNDLGPSTSKLNKFISLHGSFMIRSENVGELDVRCIA